MALLGKKKNVRGIETRNRLLKYLEKQIEQKIENFAGPRNFLKSIH